MDKLLAFASRPFFPLAFSLKPIQRNYSIGHVSILIAMFVVFLCSGCEDEIMVELDSAEDILTVDAWLNINAVDQSIKLSMSQPFFDSGVPEGISDATVNVTNGTDAFTFNHTSDGNYVWASNGTSLGTVGDQLVLEIIQGGSTYQGVTKINRVPQIDSIFQEFRDDQIGGDDGIYCQFYARDPIGLGDSYWVKSFKNGQFNNKPQELNIAFDAGFDAGGGIDGLIFIPPIREFINPFKDDSTTELEPWVKDDVIRVELHSISNEAFAFMEIVRDQMTNGDNTIFAIPLANATGNVIDIATNEPVLGIFNVAAISFIQESIQ